MLSRSTATKLLKRCKDDHNIMAELCTEIDRLYQEYLAKSLTEKYTGLSNQMDKIINEANSEIVTLRDKVSGDRREFVC